jgi:hypothetical protein
MVDDVSTGCGADTLANELLTSLTAGKSFALPVVDLTGPQFAAPTTPAGEGNANRLENDDLTTRTVGGDGTFDAIMAGVSAHLKVEFEKGRITGEQYTKAYIEISAAALGNAVQFLVQRDNAYWQAVTAQLQAQVAQTAIVEARVKLEIAKVQLQALRYEANTAEVNYGLVKMKLATESVQFCTGKFQLEHMLPEQKLMIIAQRKSAEEGLEAARAQTLNTRSDGTQILGLMGKQRDLHEQQITSYKRDAETKVLKIFSDAWITMKTIDEGLQPPSGFANANLDTMLSTIRDNVGLAGTA